MSVFKDIMDSVVGDVLKMVAHEIYYSKDVRKFVLKKVDEATTRGINYFEPPRLQQTCPECGWSPDDEDGVDPVIVPLK